MTRRGPGRVWCSIARVDSSPLLIELDRVAKAPDTVRGRRVADFRRGQGGATGEQGERARNVGAEGPQFCPRRTAVITPGTLLARHD